MAMTGGRKRAEYAAVCVLAVVTLLLCLMALDML